MVGSARWFVCVLVESPDQRGQLVEVGTRKPVAVGSSNGRRAHQASLPEFLEVVGDE